MSPDSKYSQRESVGTNMIQISPIRKSDYFVRSKQLDTTQKLSQPLKNTQSMTNIRPEKLERDGTVEKVEVQESYFGKLFGWQSKSIQSRESSQMREEPVKV